jgi:hypothetical protein
MKAAFVVLLILILTLTSCTGDSENEIQPIYTGPTISDELQSDWHKTTISKVKSIIGNSLPVPT